MLSILTGLYYNTIIAWAFYYMFTSAITLFTKNDLDWATCTGEWSIGKSEIRLPMGGGGGGVDIWTHRAVNSIPPSHGHAVC